MLLASEISYLMTDSSVISHIYAKKLILRRFFFCNSIKIFNILEVTLKNRVLGLIFGVSSQKFLDQFFFVFGENIAYKIRNKGTLSFFVNLVLDFLKNKNFNCVHFFV